MGSAAFSVLLLRLTQRRFSATQFALFTSLVGLPRIVSGPISGFLVDGVGWEAFFWLTLVAGVPGMALLGRFVPLGKREPVLVPRPPRLMEPLEPGGLVARGLAGGLMGLILGILATALLGALKRLRAEPAAGFDLASAVLRTIAPLDMAGWLTLAGITIFAAVIGLMTAAVAMARRGATPAVEDDQTSSSA
jgi:PAT family beta-lactamase induction signal transducer AmpG